MAKITVLLPFYNSTEFLEDAISSILNQTYSDFELFLLDDGSTDSPKIIIDKYNDDRINYFREEENKGIVFQLNKGIDLASGLYIARMDADDISYPERFQKQLEFFENPANSEIVVLGTDAAEIGFVNEKIIHRNYKPSQISFLLNFSCPILHPTVMFRSTVFLNGMRYPDGFQYAEDLALWRMIDNGRNIAILNEILLDYRIHGSQTNKDKNRLKIQKDSMTRALELSNQSKRFFDHRVVFRTNNAVTVSVNHWFDFSHEEKMGPLLRLIIKYYKRRLKIKSQFLIRITSK